MQLSRHLLFLSLLLTGPLFADQTPSVQVHTVMLKQQAMVDTVSGYGVVSTDTHNLQTLSLPRPGRIDTLLVSAGQVVKKGAPLLVFSTSADADMAYQQARQAVTFAKNEVARIKQMVAQQLATQTDLAKAQKALVDAEAGLRAQRRIGTDQPRQRILAPYDAIIQTVQAAQGDRLAAGAPLLQLAKSGAQRVLLGIEPNEVQRVQAGMPVHVTSVFNSEGTSGIQVQGRVTQVFGMINSQTQLVDVLVALPQGGLMTGTRVHADIEIARQTRWVVPRSAVLRDTQGAYLFQVVKGKAKRVNVETGLEHTGLIAVQGPFDTAQPVVSLGNYELQDGMAVREGGQ